MAVTVPNALALATIADGSAIVASDHRNNYQAVQVGVNGLIAMFAAAPTKGDLLVSTGGGNFDRLPVGTNGQAIVADSTQPLGIKYGSVGAIARKNTAKQVLNTVAETDLLNGEVTIAANALGTTGILRLTAFGDWVQTTGASQNTPHLKLKLGATTLLDASVLGTAAASSATRFGWKIVVEITALGATNAQWAALQGAIAYLASTSTHVGGGFTTGSGSTVWLGDVSGTNPGQAVIVGGGSSAVDMTVAQVLALTATLPTATATIDITLRGALVELL